MSIFDKLKKKKPENNLPKSLQKYENSIDVQIVKAKAGLSTLEDKTKAKIYAEINNVKYHRAHKKNDPRAIVRLKNSYYCLLLIKEAKERMNDIEASYELDGILKGLSAAIKMVNGLEGKTDSVNTFFLKYREKKLKRNSRAAKEGDMREFFSQSIDELITDEAVEELLSKKKPLNDILQDDNSLFEEADYFFGKDNVADSLDVDDIMNADLNG
ncbi:MAG: hypothetical protein U0L12_07325 [Ruminococcus sp.]|nr:hypothetical protein [Ruminococcus sp.]